MDVCVLCPEQATDRDKARDVINIDVCCFQWRGNWGGGLAGAENLQLFGWGARNVFQNPQLEELWSAKK